MEIKINQHDETNIISIKGECNFHVGATGERNPSCDTENPIVVEALFYAIERIGELEAENEQIKDLVRFLAGHIDDLDLVIRDAAKLEPFKIVDHLIMNRPVIQGTRNQLNLSKIGKQELNTSNLIPAVTLMLNAIKNDSQ